MILGGFPAGKLGPHLLLPLCLRYHELLQNQEQHEDGVRAVTVKEGEITVSDQTVQDAVLISLTPSRNLMSTYYLADMGQAGQAKTLGRRNGPDKVASPFSGDEYGYIEKGDCRDL